LPQLTVGQNERRERFIEIFIAFPVIQAGFGTTFLRF
jgi:hypothetical protein